MNPIITVQEVSKKYFIGKKQKYVTLRDSIENVFKFSASKIFGGGSLITKEDTVFWALHDVSFDVNQGETLGVIGANGAGKSTILKILSRITYPTTGQVKLRGRIASLLEVGTGFHQELTGRENIYLNGAILGMKRSEIKRKFDEIVAFSGVEKFIDTPVKHFSSGMYVRLAFSIAAHLDSDLLLIDEVLSVGDAEFQKKSLSKMEKITKEGRTIIFVSHNTEAIQRLCNRVILFDGGRIALDSTDTSTVVSRYLENAKETPRNLNRKPRGIETGNGLARFTSVSLTDGSGKQIPEVEEMVPFKVKLRVTTKHKRKIGSLVVTFTNQENKDILASISQDTIRGLALEDGDNDFEVSINPNVFTPGVYSIEFVCTGVEGDTYDISKNNSMLIVSPHHGADKFISRAGLIRLIYHWKRLNHE